MAKALRESAGSEVARIKIAADGPGEIVLNAGELKGKRYRLEHEAPSAQSSTLALHVLREGVELGVAGRVDEKMDMKPARDDASGRPGRILSASLARAAKPAVGVRLGSDVHSAQVGVVMDADWAKKAGQQRAPVAQRMDKDELIRRILVMFTYKEYLHFSEVRKVTGQPENYLRSTLQEIAVQMQFGPNRNKWELKTENKIHRDGDAPMD
ncbi:unnamed protein product [Pedinophyceae sp. YPF-701]|nr:unnamed protein product [Pedinophyceae sp. YPF-701]